MGKPAARIGDMHMCPMVTPGLPPVPHVGGPITGPGCPTVLIGGMPAAVMGDVCVCVGPPSSVVLGSAGVFIGGKPAARMGDMTAHGGTITVGLPTVLIGEISAGSVSAGGSIAAFASLPVGKQRKLLKGIDKKSIGVIEQMCVLIQAAKDGIPFCEKCIQSPFD